MVDDVKHYYILVVNIFTRDDHLESYLASDLHKKFSEYVKNAKYREQFCYPIMAGTEIVAEKGTWP
jgi:hypothetical protein